MMPFARFISSLFDPLIILPVAVVLSARNHLGADEFMQFVFWFVFGGVAPVAIARWLLVKTKKVSDWDLTKRHERIGPFLGLFLFALFQYALVSRLGNEWIGEVMRVCLVWFLGFALITLRYKISGHVAAVTLAAGLLMRALGGAWWPVFLVVPLVGWARVVGKHHSVGQVIAGAAYSLIIVTIL